MKDIFDSVFKVILGPIILPFYMAVFALYGIRVWSYNMQNKSFWDGNWTFTIPKKP